MSKVKLSNRKILTDVNILKSISQKQLPVRVSYAIAKNINKIEGELKLYNKERGKLVDKYAEKDKEGKVISDENRQIKFKDQEGWNKDINELLDIENEIEIHKFNIAEFNNKPCEFSPSELMTIDYMIEE